MTPNPSIKRSAKARPLCQALGFYGAASQSSRFPTRSPIKMGSVAICSPLSVALRSPGVAASRYALTAIHSEKVSHIVTVSSTATVLLTFNASFGYPRVPQAKKIKHQSRGLETWSTLTIQSSGTLQQLRCFAPITSYVGPHQDRNHV